MIEFIDQQVETLANSRSTASKPIRLQAVEYDDTTWSRDELEGLIWQVAESEDWDEFDEVGRPSSAPRSSS